MWISFIKDVPNGQHKTGERIDKETGAAQTLIDLGYAQKCEAPSTDPSDASKALLGDVIGKAVNDGIDKLRTELKPITKRFSEPQGDSYELGTAKKFIVPATARKYSSLKHLQGDNADERAYRFGMWCLANYAINGKIADPERQEQMNEVVRRCKNLNIPIRMVKSFDSDSDMTVEKNLGGEAVVTKTQGTVNNVSSAFLVPEDFENDIIDLREKFGVFRQNAKIVPMASDLRSDPRRKQGLQYYYVGESTASSRTDKQWDRVELKAKKLMVLSKYSNELNEDAVINIGDDLMGEIAYAFAYAEDVAGFVGDGTSTYGGIQGVTTKLKGVSSTIANIMGLQVASGTGYATSYGSIVLGDFNGVNGRLPEFADENNAKWYVSRSFWGTIMQKLATAAGGNRVMDIQNGARVKEFLGYPVVIAQAMPKTPAVSQVVAVFGDLAKAASFGTRRGVSLSISDVALNAFEQDELAIRGTQRFDINVHDVGEDSTATARDSIQGTLAGPVVGLITAAS